MRCASFFVAIVLFGFYGVAEAQTQWPDFMGNLEPGMSNSPVATYLPANIKITPPATDVPPAKAAWSGKWSGWACADQACDTKLVVEMITSDDAAIVYSFASEQIKPFVRRARARFVGDELQADLGGGARITYRMRADGNADFLWTRGSAWAAGILAKEK